MRESKDFEYMPKWIRKGIRVNVYCEGKWYSGKITSTPKTNDRGVEITTVESTSNGGHTVSIPVYMCYRTEGQWNEMLKRGNAK